MHKRTRRRHLASLLVAVACQVVLTAHAAGEPPLHFGPAFPLTEAMRERVLFWVRIFTSVSQTEAVLHDRDDLRIVYDVVPFGEAGFESAIDAARGSYARMLVSTAFHDFTPAVSRLAAIHPPAPERVQLHALFASAGIGKGGHVRAAANVRAQRGLREVFAESLVRAELYLPSIRRVLRDLKLPAELAYLPHVESSFNPNAVSRAGAAGLWQLMPGTAEPALKIGPGRDERLDPIRSTRFAASHLARAYSLLGNWPLAVAAYNHGLAGIARARAAVGSDSLDDIIRAYESPSFGFASQNFYAEFLAAVHVARNAAAYFPELKRSPVLQYVVRPGDSLWKIARKHRVSVRALAAANNIGRTPLQRGQRILIRL